MTEKARAEDLLKNCQTIDGALLAATEVAKVFESQLPPITADYWKRVIEEVKKLPEKPITMLYKNWKGTIRMRQIIPVKVWYGNTKFHPENQLLLKAVDFEDKEVKDFAISGFETPERGKERDLLHEAMLQIEYLQQKFQETGSGNSVLAKLKAHLGI